MADSFIHPVVVTSLSHDPFFNLAVEEYLLEGIGKNEIILYLWQNKNTVVIGRNQNPWRECRCSELEADGGHVVRRLSGGGAVFHDLGNLNFTFIAKTDRYDYNKQIEVVLDALKRLGIDAGFSGRNDITVYGRKLSGNAFYQKEDRAFHHGTILVDTDISILSRYLQVQKEKINSKGINSVSSRVINLKELNSHIDVSAAVESLKQSFRNIYGTYREASINDGYEPVRELYDKYSSWEWTYGQTPDFDISYDKRFEWGSMEVCFKLREGYIESCIIYSDAMDTSLAHSVETLLAGAAFTWKAIDSRFKEAAVMGTEARTAVNDMRNWLVRFMGAEK